MADSSRSYLRRKVRFPNGKRIADDEFMAAAIGDTEWLRHSLREAKGQINFDKNGLSALHLSAIHGRMNCLKLLIEKYKVDINLPSSTGWRAVHLCISNQTGKRALICLQYLVTKKADLSIPNNDGITPVHQAASEGHVQCLKLLIQNGANIVGKDCRGHTPLDLAKLWGHKNCARLLAAELWHQDKDNVFKEMGHLRKLKMQQVLKEMNDQDEQKAIKQQNGEKAFDEWLQKKELPKSSVGPVARNAEEEEESSPPVPEPSKGSKGNNPGKRISVYSQAKRSPFSPEDSLSSPNSSRRLRDTNDDQGLQDDATTNEATKLSSKKKFPETWVNPDPWKLALHPPSTEYITNLPDEYPRDEYTKMPVTKSGPKYFDGRHGHQNFVADDSIRNKKTSKPIRKPNLPNEVIEKYLSKDPTLQERPVIFKPVHMYDIHKKKKFEAEDQMKGEVSLHLCDDFTSILYQRSLTDTSVIENKSKTASSKSRFTPTDLMPTQSPGHNLRQLQLKAGRQLILT